MAENTKIEWATHTFNPWSVMAKPGNIDGMDKPVARLAQGDAVRNNQPHGWVCGKRFDVVGVEVSAFIIAAVSTAETVAAHYIEPPSAPLGRLTKVFALFGFSINVAMAVRPSRRPISRSLTDQLSRLDRVRFPNPIARPRLCSRAHFGAAFVRHL